jgi:cupin superfamily acireductone dioxygenase involved in methionine salvage
MDQTETPPQISEDSYNFIMDLSPQMNTIIQIEIHLESLAIHQMFKVLCNDMKYIKQELQEYKQEIKTLKTSNDFLLQKFILLELQTNQYRGSPKTPIIMMNTDYRYHHHPPIR